MALSDRSFKQKQSENKDRIQARAEYYLARGDYKVAAREFRLLLSKRNTRFRLGYGIALMGMGNLRGAAYEFETIERRGGSVPLEVNAKLKSLIQAQSGMRSSSWTQGKPKSRRKVRFRSKRHGLSMGTGGKRKHSKSGKRRNKRRTVRSSGRGGGQNYDKFGGEYVHSRPSRGSVRLIY